MQHSNNDANNTHDDSALAKIVEGQLKKFGNEVIIVVPDDTLEQVGEAVLIATHSEYDRKAIGRLCFREALKHLLGPQHNPASIVIS